MLILIRHASIIDNALPAAFVSGPHGMFLRFVLKQELKALPTLDMGARWVPTALVHRASKAPDAEIARVRSLGSFLHGTDEGALIYPEGTRARDGLLHKGHTGVARLALRTGAPIVPVGIIGSNEVHPPDARYPHPFRRVHIRFGRPIGVERYKDRAGDRLVLRQIFDEVMYEIRELTGQEYRNRYATKQADSLPAETAVVAHLHDSDSRAEVGIPA